MTILVVDDDAAIREVLAELLTDEGYCVETAANGAEALTYLQAAPRTCVILLDLMMPLMNGWEFRAAQRQDPALATIPVVTISANAEFTGHIASLGVAEHLCKPVDFDRLIATVQRYCGEHGATA